MRKKSERWSYGITSDMWSLRPEHGFQKPFYVCLPPFSEQTAIVRFLDHTDRRIRRYIRAREKLIGTVNRAGRETSLINEYRTRLIADVVTGKLDVREKARCES